MVAQNLSAKGAGSTAGRLLRGLAFATAEERGMSDVSPMTPLKGAAVEGASGDGGDCARAEPGAAAVRPRPPVARVREKVPARAAAAARRSAAAVAAVAPETAAWAAAA